jgi:DNA-binding protein
VTDASEVEKVIQLKEYEEWRGGYKEALEEYTEITRIACDTSINGCMGYIGSKFCQTSTGSIKIEALGTAISKAVTIVLIAQRESREKWGTEDFLEIEDISTSTERTKKESVSKISILLSKHSFVVARKFLENLPHLDEFDPSEIISVLGDGCRIRILKYLEIFSNDDILKNYFRFLDALLRSSRNVKRLIDQVKRERSQFETIDGTEAKGFAQGIYDLYGVIDVIDVFLSVKDIEDMTTLEKTIDSYYEKITKPERYTKTIYDWIKEVSENVRRSRDAENPYYRLYYLSEARILLEDINRIVGSRFVEPFRAIYLTIFDRWRNILNKSKEKTKINPEVKVLPEYESKSKDGMTNVKMTIENIGFVEVENMELRIIENRNFRVVDDNPKRNNILLPNRKTAFYFNIYTENRKINVEYTLEYNRHHRTFEKKDSFPIFSEDSHEEFRNIPNPYVLGRCLKPGKGGVFVGRKEIFRFIEQNFERSTKAMVFVIHGLRRTGKTSLLQYLPEKVRVDKEFIYIDMQLRRENNISDFLNAITDIISKKVDIELENDRKRQNNPYTNFEDFLESAIRKSEKGLVLMFDEFELLDKKIKDSNSDIDEGLLEFLRGIIHKEDKLTLMFAGTFDESRISTKWKILFNVGYKVSLTSLRESEARFLVEDPVKEFVLYSDISRDRLIDLSGRNPYYLQGLCRIMIDRLNREERNYVRNEDVEEIQNDAIDALTYSYDHFWDSLSFLEKKICKILARLQLRDHDVTISDIRDSLEEKSDYEEIRNFMEDLVTKEILEKYGQDIPRYRFTIELLAYQIDRFGRY